MGRATLRYPLRAPITFQGSALPLVAIVVHFNFAVLPLFISTAKRPLTKRPHGIKYVMQEGLYKFASLYG